MQYVTKKPVRFDVQAMIAEARRLAGGMPQGIVPASYIKTCMEQIDAVLGKDFSYTTPEAFFLKRMSDYHRGFANSGMYFWAFEDIFDYCPF